MNAGMLLGFADLFTIGALIVFIVIPLIGVIATKIREMSQVPPQMPAEGGGGGRIEEQIEDFLRRAAQRRGAPQPPAAQETPPLVAEIVQDEGRVGGQVDAGVQRRMDTSEFSRRTESLGGEVAQHDRQFTQQVQQAFSGQVSRLADRPGEAAQPIEVVDAEVVEADQAIVAATVAEDAALPALDGVPDIGLAGLLGSPEGMAQAVIMNEILRRPEW